MGPNQIKESRGNWSSWK